MPTDLPDELWMCTFSALSIMHRLCVVDRVCKRFQVLLRHHELWTLPRLTYVKAMAPLEASQILHAVCTKRHVLQALVTEVEARNDEDRNGWPGLHGGEPLAGRTVHNDLDMHLYKELCRTAKLAPSAAFPLSTWQELAVVVEVRRGFEQSRCESEALPAPIDTETRTWIVEAASEGGCGCNGEPRATIADFDVETVAEAGLLPFGRRCFVVVWAVHRRTNAVALLHAAEPEGEAPGGYDSNNHKVQVRGEKNRNNVMRAASNVPRRLDDPPVFKVHDFLDGTGFIPRRERRADAVLVARVTLSPVWERTGCTGTELLIDPREGGLEAGDARADAVADGWWPCRIQVELEIDGAEHVAQARPVYHGSYDIRRFPENRKGLSEYIRAQAMWARACVLPLLADDVLWVEPRGVHHLLNHEELASRVRHFLNRVQFLDVPPPSDDEAEDDPSDDEPADVVNEKEA